MVLGLFVILTKDIECLRSENAEKVMKNTFVLMEHKGVFLCLVY